MEKFQNDKKIRPILLTMRLRDVELWPIQRADTVRTTIYRLQPQTGKRWSTRTTNDVLSVTRIA